MIRLIRCRFLCNGFFIGDRLADRVNLSHLLLWYAFCLMVSTAVLTVFMQDNK